MKLRVACATLAFYMGPLFDHIAERHHGNESGFSRHYLTLYSIVLGMEAKNVLELGAGFSTQTILEALKHTGGKLVTCDVRDLKDTGNPDELHSMYASSWTYLQGDTRETLQTLPTETRFDVVLHDGSHEWRVVYKDLRKILPRIKQNGILLVHDTEHTPTYRLKMATRLALIGYRHEIVTLPYGFGLTIVRILGNKKNGTISLSWGKKKS